MTDQRFRELNIYADDLLLRMEESARKDIREGRKQLRRIAHHLKETEKDLADYRAMLAFRRHLAKKAEGQ